ncbi:hypothetical protein BDV96DRAFT_652145 [Lophiotrema nucula]|uniref:DUF8004 domain-containing protein n=1 Tax=Lophiotrema nucula TaxID=690887 RepID=A0A6A5YT91_9PLEO|nr:hypothetical protein BDV96DRAFT_652145 [Lophiotrema nucula]
MSARGARSRKAVAKDIEKKEKKAAEKGKAVESIRRPHDAFADWRPTPSRNARDTSVPSRSITLSSDLSRTTSRSSSTNGSANRSRPRLGTINSSDSLEIRPIRPKTSASAANSISDTSTTGKERTKYDSTKGKGSKAPRGRGGGVPIKRSNVTSPAPPIFRAESTASHTRTNHKTWANFRVWEGGESGLRPYGGFDFDEDMKSGNVLIYFKEEQMSEDRPVPQIRCDLDVLENSGSTWLSNALLYGRIDDNEDEWTLPGSPETSMPGHGFLPNTMHAGQRRMLGPTSPGGMSPPPFNIDGQQYFGVPGRGGPSRSQFYPDSERAQSPPPFQGHGPAQATHELWFTAPATVRTPQAQRLHHVAVRNFLAMLHNKPIVGADLFEMLCSLQPEIQVMYDLDHDDRARLTPRERSVQMITQYLSDHKLDDMRNSIKLALGLLAWAEQDTVRWRQGYLESFVHLAGIMSPQIEDLADFKRLSIVTRRNLGIAAKTLQLKIMEAEEKLSSFDFNDLWADNPKGASSPVYQSYSAFRQFLINYYTKIYGNWPPNQGKSWLNRRMVLELQEDFGALYDYLVNRDVVWDSQEERPGKKWQLRDQTREDFRPDHVELNLEDMLVTFDNRHGFLHIPHPYPLLPREVQSAKAPQKKSFFGLKKSAKVDATKDAKAHLQLSIVFSDATNIEKLDVSFNGSTLIDQFERFELSSDLAGVSPRQARLGRWVLLYGVLQVLSKLSVDIQGLKWTEGVRYFLCTDLKRCPDWVTQGQIEIMEATQQRSWCWQRPWGPTPLSRAPVELDGSSAPVGSGELDGATMLNNDIQRISEKIDDMGIGRMRNYERRIENEKIKQDEFSMTKRVDDSYRLTENDFVGRPLVPNRSPLRSPTGPNNTPLTQQRMPHTSYHPDRYDGWA